MRTLALLALTGVLACGESPSTDNKRVAPAEPTANAVAGQIISGDAKITNTPKLVPLECDQWLARDLLKSHCGVDLPLTAETSEVQTAYTCSRAAKQGGSRVTVTFEKLIGGTLGPAVKRRYPDPPELKKKHSNGKTVKGRKFPYLLTVDSRGEPLCTDEQTMAFASAIIAALPTSEEPASNENKACDALLTSADIKSKCNKEASVSASMMENGKSLYCNRSWNGLIFIVSKHASDDLAKRGAAIAREDTTAGVAHKGRYSIEMKTSMGSTICDASGLDALAKLVAERL